jgi:hypothetical protein
MLIAMLLAFYSHPSCLEIQHEVACLCAHHRVESIHAENKIFELHVVSYYIDISPNYSLIIPKTAVLSIRGLGPGA